MTVRKVLADFGPEFDPEHPENPNDNCFTVAVDAEDYDALSAENARLRSQLAEATGRLDAANKHVEVLQNTAGENYDAWCKQMAVLREREADASMAAANLHKRINEWAAHCEGVEARLVEVQTDRDNWIATAELYYKEEQALEKRLASISRDYEELRKEIDGGSESMTHVDAVGAAREYRDQIHILEQHAKSWRREAEMMQQDVKRLDWLEQWIADNSSGGEIYPIGPEFEFGPDDQIVRVLSWAIADKEWPVATMREAIDAAMGEP